jgi:hypothetical protein
VVNHYRIETSEWYPRKAAIIGSHCFDLPVGETDNYLRAYQSREPIGDWGRQIVERVSPEQAVFLYRGSIFQHMRFDYMIAITASVIRRSVFETLGLPEARWATGSDYHFLARMCKAFQANYLSIPTFVKHEFGVDGALPAVGHVVTGKSALAFAKEWQSAWDDLFWTGVIHDREQCAMRGLRQLWIAKVALESGQRALTLECLRDARQGVPRFRSAIALHWLVRCLPGTELPRKVLRAYQIIAHRCSLVFRKLSGKWSPLYLLRKISGPLRNARNDADMRNTSDGV